MKITAHFKPLPISAAHNCFGCSPKNATGLQMQFFTHDDAVFSRVAVPAHLCGWNTVAHGGVLGTILDETMSWAAMYLLKQISLTQTMTVNFLKPVAIGTVLEAESRVLELKGKRGAVVDGVLTDEGGTRYATSTGTFQTFSPDVARRLKIVDDALLAWYQRLIAT